MFGSKRLAAAMAALVLLTSIVPATALAADGSAEGSTAAEAEATVHVENDSVAVAAADGDGGEAVVEAESDGEIGTATSGSLDG